MLVTFSTANYANIMMFGDAARQLLTMMGHSGSIPGAILAEDVAQSLERLKNALIKTTENSVDNGDEGNDDTQPENISLKNRAIPLIDLLNSAVKNKHDVMWK